ncbi:MAG: hypothetical protein ABJA98_13025 [Acidobacteriota bacterium]
MNHTRRLMTYVTTSMLMAGSHTGVLAADAPNAAVSTQDSSRSSQNRKTDPKVQQAANDIYEWLKDTPKDQARTSDEIAKNFPALEPGQLKDALSLLSMGRLKTTGNGTKADPLRYFGARSSSEG